MPTYLPTYPPTHPPTHPPFGIWFVTPKGEDDSKLAVVGTPDLPSEPCAGGHATEIDQLLDTDSHQASTQKEPVNSLSSELSSGDTSEDSSEDGIISVPDSVHSCYRV